MNFSSADDVTQQRLKRKAEEKRQRLYTIGGTVCFGILFILLIVFVLNPSGDPRSGTGSAKINCTAEDDCPLLFICSNKKCDVKPEGCEGGCPAGYSCQPKNGGGVKCQIEESSNIGGIIRILVISVLAAGGLILTFLAIWSFKTQENQRRDENDSIERTFSIEKRNDFERRIKGLEEKNERF